jgi:SulP family sulfate permease
MLPLHPFRPRLVDALQGYDAAKFARDVGAGLTVGIVALPLAMAFAIASGVKPEAGIFTAIIAGLLISALGGSNVQIGGPAGAFIAIVYGNVERYGLANLLIATVLAGVLPFARGLLKLAALAGILLFVAWNMGEWHEFARLRRFAPTYRIILVGTFVLTVVFDLTVAVEIGLVLACVFCIWRMGRLFGVRPHGTDDVPPGVFVFELYGSLFFGAVGKIEALPAQLPAGTRAVVLEMHRLISMDTSGLEALQQLHRTLQRRDVGLVLANVNEQPLSLIRRSGFSAVIGEDAIEPNVAEAVGQFG